METMDKLNQRVSEIAVLENHIYEMKRITDHQFQKMLDTLAAQKYKYRQEIEKEELTEVIGK